MQHKTIATRIPVERDRSKGQKNLWSGKPGSFIRPIPGKPGSFPRFYGEMAPPTGAQK